ncbi:MAG: VWA domain-containing protein, partial [Chromatiaceae bacterium]|nr:VWA domain-containing protein [Chromatiaceae bacterium]
GPTCERLEQPLFGVERARLLLLDLSPSLGATDVSPSRLARARFELLDILNAIDEGQVGLVVFGAAPYLVAPLTHDARTIAAQAPLLAPELLPREGARRTDLALAEAARLLTQAGAGEAEILLISDELGAAQAALEQARALRAAGHRLSVLAVGTPQGAPVPAPDGGSYVTEPSGEVRFSRLDRAGLRALAEAGGGRYAESEVGDADTRAWLALGSMAMALDRQEQAASAERWREAGPWLLLPLLPLAALAFRRGSPLLGLLLLGLFVPPAPALALGWEDLWQRPDQQGARALAAGEVARAAERFADPAWRAAAQARAGDYAAALETLNGLEGAEAAYNRGNALARLGRLAEAEAAYAEALRLDPEHADARHNLELVRAARRDESPQEQESGDEQGREQASADGEGSESQNSGQNSGQGEDQSGDQAEGRNGAQEQAANTEADGAPDDASQSSPQSGEAAGHETPAAPGAERASPPEDGSGRAQGEALGMDDAGDANPFEESGALDASAGLQGLAPEEARESERAAPLSPAEREREQALEAQLRRVPDDPAGLLRQRFLLQELRREGQWP